MVAHTLLRGHRQAAAIICTLMAFIPGRDADAATRTGEAVFEAECAACHNSAAPRMPSRESLAAHSPASIVRTLESGTMRVVGTFNLNGPERVAVAEYLTGKTYDPNWAPQQGQACAPAAWSGADAFQRPHWNGWGNGPANTRFQSAANAGLNAAGASRLELQWAFAFPGETIAESQPSVVGERIFVGSRSGMVYALDAKRGCVYWTYQADGPVKNSVLIAPLGADDEPAFGAFFGDLIGNTYAVDAATGALLWRKRVDDHPAARIMGSLQFADGQLLIPVTSVESTLAAAADAECCVFRGSVVSLDPATGQQNWKRYTVPEAVQTGTNAKGVATYGPSGAGVWSAPTYDARSRVAYIGTGENYSNPPTATSDSIFAVNIDSGDVLWTYQALAGDAWNMSCGTADPVNCPQDTGPDYDFGSSPILTTLASGQRLIVAGQKSGVLHALDPDAGGKLLWQRQLAQGGVLGGIEWGSATDGKRVYVAIADIRWNTTDLLDPKLALDPNAGGGLVAVNLQDGEIAWQAPGIDCAGRSGCSPAQTAAVTAIPGVVFAGSMSGEMRAFDTDSGRVIWHFDTAREFATVNGAAGRGGALDATGAVVVDGWVYVTSGYNKWGGLPGNVLLGFKSAR